MKQLKECLINESKFNLNQANAYVLGALLAMYNNGKIKEKDLISNIEDNVEEDTIDIVKKQLQNTGSLQMLEDDLFAVDY